mmetsp:Transcript_106021/g.298083  ORF Transcript_106021/g.298083 Transcript_106021/m.298083 type:complete len:212 (+) Transcript_106021:191-826(+)
MSKRPRRRPSSVASKTLARRPAAATTLSSPAAIASARSAEAINVVRAEVAKTSSTVCSGVLGSCGLEKRSHWSVCHASKRAIPTIKRRARSTGSGTASSSIAATPPGQHIMVLQTARTNSVRLRRPGVAQQIGSCEPEQRRTVCNGTFHQSKSMARARSTINIPQRATGSPRVARPQRRRSRSHGGVLRAGRCARLGLSSTGFASGSGIAQ